MLKIVLFAAVAFLHGTIVSRTLAAPVPVDPVKEKEKAIQDLVAKVTKAFGAQDSATLADLCEAPFIRDHTVAVENKSGLKDYFRRGLQGKEKYDGLHEIKSLETYGKAKAKQGRFEDFEVKKLDKLIANDDYVLHVEVDYPGKKMQLRYFVKFVDDKPKLIGLGGE